MAHYTQAGVVGQYPFQAHLHHLRTIRHNHLTGMQGITDACTTAMMKADSGGPTHRIDSKIQKRPIGNGIGAVLQSFRFAIGRRHRAEIQMVAPDDDGCFHPAFPHQAVE